MRKSDITAAVVACLVCEQRPDLAHLPIVPVDVDGWDNSTFRVGEGLLARLPTDDGYVSAVDKEHRWLPVLGPRLPVEIPEPVTRGVPGCGFPRPWSLYRWLPGETAAGDRVGDLDGFARDVAGFLTALRSVDPTGGPPAGAHSFGRGGPPQVYDADVRGSLDALPSDVRVGDVLRVWDAAVAAPFDGPPRWFHGDLAPSNLLVRDGRLHGVIDFGTCGVGDPACDLVLAWTFFDGATREVFRQALGTDDGAWARGRGWALWKALLTLDGSDPVATERRYGWRHTSADIVRHLVADT